MFSETAPPVRSSEVKSFLSDQPPVRSGMPTWLMAFLFAIGIVAVIAGLYWLLGTKSESAAATAGSSAAAAPAKGPADALSAVVEVSGVRFIEDPKHKDKVLAKLLVVNHSSADLSGDTVTASFFAAGQKSTPVGVIKVAINLPPYESHEVTVPLQTSLKAYELPDWQVMTSTVEVTQGKS